MILSDRISREYAVSVITHGFENTQPGGPHVIAERVVRELRHRNVSAHHLYLPDDIASLHGVCHFLNAPGVERYLNDPRIKNASRAFVVTPTHLDLGEIWRWEHWVDRILQLADGETTDRTIGMVLDCFSSEPSIRNSLGRKVRRWRKRYLNYIHMLQAASYGVVARQSDAVVALSSWEAAILASHGVEMQRIFTVPNPVDIDRFRTATTDASVELIGETGFVLCVGRVGYRKNQLMIAAAMRGLPHRLVIVGKVESPRYASLIRRLLGDRVTFIDYMPHDVDLLPSLYRAAGVFVLPSWTEGAPLSGLEAWASGLPLILSDIPPHIEIFGDNARYVRPDDPKALRQAIQDALGTRPPVSRDRIGTHLNRHSYAAHCATLHGVYETAIQNRNAKRGTPEHPSGIS